MLLLAFLVLGTINILISYRLPVHMALRAARGVGGSSVLWATPCRSQAGSFSTVGPRYQIKQIQDDTRHRAVNDDGPTAVVFMNMGGPVDQEEVPHFLRRLFVRHSDQPLLRLRGLVS